MGKLISRWYFPLALKSGGCMKILLASLLALSTNVYAQSEISEAAAEAEHYLTTFSPACMMADDEVYPRWQLELANFSQGELEGVIESEFNAKTPYSEIPYECSENPSPAPEAVQKAFLKQYPGIKGSKHGKAADNPCKLTEAELAAIGNYTGNGYYELNKNLREKNDTREACMKRSAMIATLNGALSKIAPYMGYVRRNVQLPEKVLEYYKPGQVVRESSYLSTSTALVFQGTNTRFIILGKNCVNVEVHSSAYGEKEVLCPANSEFVVMARKTMKSGYHTIETILMEQIR